jgi:hypothetical protein
MGIRSGCARVPKQCRFSDFVRKRPYSSRSVSTTAKIFLHVADWPIGVRAEIELSSK